MWNKTIRRHLSFGGSGELFIRNDDTSKTNISVRTCPLFLPLHSHFTETGNEKLHTGSILFQNSAKLKEKNITRILFSKLFFCKSQPQKTIILHAELSDADILNNVLGKKSNINVFVIYVRRIDRFK